MPGSVCPEELVEKLKTYCNWASLPQDLLLLAHRGNGSQAGTSSNSSSGSDAQLPAFLQHLTKLVPFEWSVLQRSVFDTGGIDASSTTSRQVKRVPWVGALGFVTLVRLPAPTFQGRTLSAAYLQVVLQMLPKAVLGRSETPFVVLLQQAPSCSDACARSGHLRGHHVLWGNPAGVPFGNKDRQRSVMDQE